MENPSLLVFFNWNDFFFNFCFLSHQVLCQASDLPSLLALKTEDRKQWWEVDISTVLVFSLQLGKNYWTQIEPKYSTSHPPPWPSVAQHRLISFLIHVPRSKTNLENQDFRELELRISFLIRSFKAFWRTLNFWRGLQWPVRLASCSCWGWERCSGRNKMSGGMSWGWSVDSSEWWFWGGQTWLERSWKTDYGPMPCTYILFEQHSSFKDKRRCVFFSLPQPTSDCSRLQLLGRVALPALSNSWSISLFITGDPQENENVFLWFVFKCLICWKACLWSHT